MAGNKETKEAAIALVVVGIAVSVALKDGFQLQDVVDIYGKLSGDPRLVEVLGLAWENIDQVSTEIKDLNFLEIFDIVSAVIKELNK
jgi:hypothetical protein